jgi:hypothetical protein
MNNLWRDFRFGFRLLRKNPGFATVAVLALALGIGATTAVYSIVHAQPQRHYPLSASGTHSASARHLECRLPRFPCRRSKCALAALRPSTQG